MLPLPFNVMSSCFSDHVIVSVRRLVQLYAGEEASIACELRESIVVGTSRRVLFLAADTMVRLRQFEIRGGYPVGALFPVGDSVVIFADDNKLRYIYGGGVGLILSNLSGTKRRSRVSPLEVLADRLVFVDESRTKTIRYNDVRVGACDANGNSRFLSSEVVTRPLFLLEVLILACVKDKVDRDVVLEVIKTFGKKTECLPFKEGQGK